MRKIQYTNSKQYSIVLLNLLLSTWECLVLLGINTSYFFVIFLIGMTFCLWKNLVKKMKLAYLNPEIKVNYAYRNIAKHLSCKID